MNRLQYTVEARVSIDVLPEARRNALEKALHAVREDPYHSMSASVNAEGNLRRVHATDRIFVEYAVFGPMALVVVIEVFDELEALVEE